MAKRRDAVGPQLLLPVLTDHMVPPPEMASDGP